MKMNEVFIVAGTRTPFGSFQGKLAAVETPRLGATAIRAAVASAGLFPDEVSDVLMGNVLQAGIGQAPARQAAIFAGLSESTRCTTINKVCGSGMEAVILGTRALALEETACVVAGGMENMSATPYLLPNARKGYRIGHQHLVDAMIHDGLWDPYNRMHMGACAEQYAQKFSLAREEQDAYAIESFRRATAAQLDGWLAGEITPVEVTDGHGNVSQVSEDEGPSKVHYDKIPTLRPAFSTTGTITAANASTINDGAVAIVLINGELVRKRGLKPLARVVSYGGHAQQPLWFTSAPVQAARNALAKACWRAADVDLWEVNEAFATVPLVFMRELALSREMVNVRGGAISLGHPIGASGARIILTLIRSLQSAQKKRGLAAICIGGGEGLAVCVELC